MCCGGEPAHVGADLRQDDLGAQLTDPWDSTQLFDSVAKASKAGIGLPVDLGNGSIERVHLLQMQSKQKTMVTFNASMQRFAQGCCRRTHLPMCKCSQFGRIALAIDQRLQDAMDRLGLKRRKEGLLDAANEGLPDPAYEALLEDARKDLGPGIMRHIRYEAMRGLTNRYLT